MENYKSAMAPTQTASSASSLAVMQDVAAAGMEYGELGYLVRAAQRVGPIDLLGGKTLEHSPVYSRYPT